MMERCPVCRARFAGKTVCRRCKSDLSSLLQLEAQADRFLHLAISALLSGDMKKARKLCRYATHIKKTPLNTALAGFVDFQLASKEN